MRGNPRQNRWIERTKLRVGGDFHLLEGKLFVAHQAGDIRGHIHRRSVERGGKNQINLVSQWTCGQRAAERAHGHGRNPILNKL